jgi:hypothetical protein
MVARPYGESALAVNTSDDLEMVIESARLLRGTSKSDSTPSFAEVYAAMVARLSVENIPYVLTGAIAFGLYARARATDNIDILTTAEASSAVNAVAAHLELRFTRIINDRSVFVEPRSGIEINLWAGKGEPFRSAVAAPGHHLFLGVDTKVIKPEYLLWLYCLVDTPKHSDMAIQLINAGKVDLALLRTYLSGIEDTATRRTLDAAVLSAERDHRSSYSESVKRRLAKPGPRGRARSGLLGSSRAG